MKPVYIKRNEISQHLGKPKREKDETYSEYKLRREKESRLFSLYMNGTPIDKEVKENYIDITDDLK